MQRVKVNIPSLKKHNFTTPFTFARVPIKATIMLPDETELVVYVAHLKSNRDNEFEYIFNKEHELAHKQELVAKKFKVSKQVLLTYNQEELVEGIEVVPFWKYFWE